MSRQTETLSRRDLLARGAALAAMVSAKISLPQWMPRLAFAPKNSAPRGDVLVCIFLRGGADGLNMIVPYGDDDYYKARPQIAIARPDTKKTTTKVVDLDGYFGLNPLLGYLLPLFQAGHMTAIHAAGSPGPTRSHFDAMNLMERGAFDGNAVDSGWLGRHLASLNTNNNSPLRAIGWAAELQQSLHGSMSAIALGSIINYHLAGLPGEAAKMVGALNALYSGGDASLKPEANQALEVLDLISHIDAANYHPGNGSKYNRDDGFGLALMQTAALIKADVGLEIAAIDVGGWDTHTNQAAAFSIYVTVLAAGLLAFYTDLGDAIKKVTVVIMSEFGRRVEENASLGTDHGHGNMMLVMGGAVTPKPVIANWPTLAKDKLDRGDLAITIDYRDILSEIVTLRLNNPALDIVFPGFKPTLRGVVTKSY